MDNIYWLKQPPGKPLFPDLIWSRPENRMSAGKLLIVGGNAHGFAVPSEAYQEAIKAGIGTCRVVLPDAIRKLVGGFFENAFFAPSTPSGSFSRQALTEFMDQGDWADGVLLAGDFGRNSETAALLEKYVAKHSGLLAITQDALDYFLTTPKPLLDRPDTVVVASMEQLQKLAQFADMPKAVTLGMDFMNLVDWLHEFSTQRQAHIIVKQHKQMLVAVGGQISTTALTEDLNIWRVKTAAHATVWLLQNPTQPFEALSTSVINL